MFNVYPQFDLDIVRGAGAWLWDAAGRRYLDFYGGHAVISIGHSHPHYLERIQHQLQQIAFYSNAVPIGLQRELAAKLGVLSGYPDYNLFLCNSGAEANENALKLAAFDTGRSVIAASEGAFHGRTAAAGAASWGSAVQSPLSRSIELRFTALDDCAALERALAPGDVCAFIVEGVQGIAGAHVPSPSFLQAARSLCDKYGTMLILDEVQSGYGRCGAFFAHQHAAIAADMITVAKGMANGFPIGGLMIHPRIHAAHGLLGSTFGGNPLACAAGLAVLEVMEAENLIRRSITAADQLRSGLADLPALREIRGRGLLMGLEFDSPAAPLRQRLLQDHAIFTGSSACPLTLRLLPPLTIDRAETHCFIAGLRSLLTQMKQEIET